MCSCVFSDISFHIAAGKGISDWAACATSYSHNFFFCLIYLYHYFCIHFCMYSSVLQAYGMSVLPLNLIKGTRSVAYERLENTEDIDDVEHQIEKLKSKVGSAAGRREEERGVRLVTSDKSEPRGHVPSATSSTISPPKKSMNKKH